MTVSEIAKLWRYTQTYTALLVNKMLAAGEVKLTMVRRVFDKGKHKPIRAYSPTALLVKRRTDAACAN